MGIFLAQLLLILGCLTQFPPYIESYNCVGGEYLDYTAIWGHLFQACPSEMVHDNLVADDELLVIWCVNETFC